MKRFKQKGWIEKSYLSKKKNIIENYLCKYSKLKTEEYKYEKYVSQSYAHVFLIKFSSSLYLLLVWISYSTNFCSLVYQIPS